MALRIAIEGQATLALVSLALGSTVLLAGDKVVRPLVARDGIHLPFVWILMACLGGFDVLGLVGLFVGPVVLALARELWDQRVRDLIRPKPASLLHPMDSQRKPVMRHAGSDLHDMRNELTCTAWSEPPRLAVRRTDMPAPRAGQVLVRVEATSVNPIDVKRAAGYGRRLLGLKGAATLPVVLGNDVAGVVQEVGPGVSRFAKDQAVFGLVGDGPRARRTRVARASFRRSNSSPRPERASSSALAMLPYSFTTMWLAVMSTGLRPSNAAG